MQALEEATRSDPLADVRRRLEPGVVRADALAELDELFRHGTVPSPLPDGFQPGTLVTTSVAGPVDAFVRRVAKLYMPWLGKRFDASEESGINVLRRSSRSQLKALWPSVTPIEAGGTLEVFPFRTWVGPGARDSDISVLKIDYDSEENPDFIIRRILDELIQIDEGFYLGKILFRTAKRWRPVGFFSLQNQ